MAGPGTANWGHVGDLQRIASQLRDTMGMDGMTEMTTAYFDGSTLTRVVELSDHVWNLTSALLTAGFRVHAGRPIRGSVELAFDNGGHGWDARFGVIVISARSGELLRMAVEHGGRRRSQPGRTAPAQWYRTYTAAADAVRDMANVPVRRSS